MNKKIIWAVSGVVGLGLIVWLAYAVAGETPPDESVAFRDVTVEGTPLPGLVAGAPDPAVGQVAPTVRGSDWKGNAVAIEPDGRSKVVVFLAHWCPHCRAEVPVFQKWVDDGGLPDDVDFYAITIMSSRAQVNFPPQTWLEREGWTIPTLMDNRAGDAQGAYAASSTPFWLVLDGENKTIGRMSGVIGVPGFEALALMARVGVPAS